MTDKIGAQELAETEAWLDNIDPDTLIVEDIADLQRLGRAINNAEAASTELRAAVAAARANGRTWAEIGASFGISRQSAQERFGRRPAPTKAAPGSKKKMKPAGRKTFAAR